MSKRGKRILKVVLVLYIAGIGLFIYDAVRNRETALLPEPVEATLSVPADPAAERAVLAKRYRARAAVEGLLEEWQLIGADELAALRKAKKPTVQVWDTALLQDFAKRKLQAGTDLKVGGTLIVGAGKPLDEDVVIRLTADREALVDDTGAEAVRDGRILVKGRGAAIGINLTMLFSILNFLVLAAALYALLWEPILKILDDRAEGIRSDIESSQARREEADELRATRQSELDELRARHDRVVQDARVQGHAERERIVREAREEAAGKIEAAELEIAAISEEARAKLRSELGDLATELSAKILEREIAAKDHRKLIDEFVGGLAEAPDGEDGQ